MKRLLPLTLSLLIGLSSSVLIYAQDTQMQCLTAKADLYPYWVPGQVRKRIHFDLFLAHYLKPVIFRFRMKAHAK